MPPQLPTASSRSPREHLESALRTLRSPRKLRGLLMRSYAPKITRDHHFPLRIRPAFVVIAVVVMIVLGLLGFHPTLASSLYINDKMLHFLCFGLATGVFYFIFDVEESARRIWVWRRAGLIFTAFVCFFVGGFISEVVQSWLPYKTFQWGDVLANLLGSSIGLFLAYHLESRYRQRREIERLYRPLRPEDDDYYDDLLDEAEEGEAYDAAGGADGGSSWGNAGAGGRGPVGRDFDAFAVDDDDGFVFGEENEQPSRTSKAARLSTAASASAPTMRSAGTAASTGASASAGGSDKKKGGGRAVRFGGVWQADSDAEGGERRILMGDEEDQEDEGPFSPSFGNDVRLTSSSSSAIFPPSSSTSLPHPLTDSADAPARTTTAGPSKDEESGRGRGAGHGAELFQIDDDVADEEEEEGEGGKR